ncbi:hypothetical protein TrVE_jg9121 [Triparma verrucosa]|uniref:EGF-like domain-containing protein n=1 Tax=Triparma verrucosa TaxID=1606542 RepID=A0A9W7B8X2_9STRA|nr:hypothetical protein TrVE_jg9121 [Triparma verrucosa]
MSCCRRSNPTATTADDKNGIEMGIVSNPLTNKIDQDKSGDHVAAETVVNRSAEGTADAVARGRGVSAADAFQISSTAPGGFLHGSGSLQETLTIAINFLQNFSLVTLLQVPWPPWFKFLFGWMEIFMLDFEFIGGAKWAVIMCGLAIIPLLVLESDHGLFRTGRFKRKDYQSVERWVGDNGEWKKMTRTNLHDFFLFTFAFILFLCLKAVSEDKLPAAWWIEEGEKFTFKQIFSEHFVFLFIYTVVFLPGINSCVEIIKIGACWRAHEVMVEGKFVPSATSYNITLSGSSQGTCYVNGTCFGTGSASGTYNSNEVCTFTFSDDAGFAVSRFDTEGGYDKLTVDGVQYSGAFRPSGPVTAGQEMTWISSSSNNDPGFEICIGDPCVASTSPSDDGSNGTFYCINGGSVGGIPGACSCTSCNMGFSGSSCDSCTNNPTVITLGILLGCVYSVVPLWLLWRTAKTVKASYASGDDYLPEIRATSGKSREEADNREADRGSVSSEFDVSATESYKAAVVGVILGSFEEKYWWWKVWLLLERAVLAVVVLTGVNPIAATTIVLVGWLSSLYARPYWDNAEDLVDLVSRTSTLFTVIAANLIYEKVVTGKEPWLELSLCASAILTIVILIYAIGPLRVFRGAVLYIRRKLRKNKISRCVVKKDFSDMSKEDLAQISTDEFAKFPLKFKESLTSFALTEWLEKVLQLLKTYLNVSEIDDYEILLKCANDMKCAIDMRKEGAVLISLLRKKVVVEKGTGKVTSINWSGQGLTGISAAAVNELTELRKLDLRNNLIEFDESKELGNEYEPFV